MGSLTLDQLLDATGVSEIAGTNITKTSASTKQSPTFSKLADRCRQALATTPDARAQTAERELVEKTAAVEIIRRTIDEIRAIEGSPPEVEKTASPQVDQAVFIKEALEAGHSPEDVASFLAKEGGVRQWWNLRRAGKLMDKSTRHAGKDTAAATKATKLYTSELARSGGKSDAAKNKLLHKIRADIGDEGLGTAIENAKAHNKYRHTDAYRQAFPKNRTSEPKPLLAANVGGKELSLSGDTAKKYLKPAAMIGGGALAYRGMTGGGDRNRSSGGRKGPVTIIN